MVEVVEGGGPEDKVKPGQVEGDHGGQHEDEAGEEEEAPEVGGEPGEGPEEKVEQHAATLGGR